MDAKSVQNMQSIIAVTNKHTAKLHHVGSLYILLMMHGNSNIKMIQVILHFLEFLLELVEIHLLLLFFYRRYLFGYIWLLFYIQLVCCCWWWWCDGVDVNVYVVFLLLFLLRCYVVNFLLTFLSVVIQFALWCGALILLVVQRVFFKCG